MNLRIVFKFKDCKLQFYEKQRLFSYFIVNPRTPASRWRRLLKLKRININSFKIIISFFFHPTTILGNKGRHFVCLLLHDVQFQMQMRTADQPLTNSFSSFCRELILFCRELILFCRELILFCLELIL